MKFVDYNLMGVLGVVFAGFPNFCPLFLFV